MPTTVTGPSMSHEFSKGSSSTFKTLTPNGHRAAGDSHFCSHEFMDWAKGKWYVWFTTGLVGNSALFKMVEKKVRMAENKFRKLDEERNSVK